MKISSKKTSKPILINQDSLILPANIKGVAAFNLLKGGAVAMGLAAIFGSAMALALSKLEETGSFSNQSVTIVRNGTEGILQMFTLLPTQGIILGIVVLIAIVLLIKTKGA